MASSNNQSKLVLLQRFYDSTQAHIIRGILESEDIPCFVMDENHNSSAWHLNIALGGVRLMVLSEDLEHARTILKEETDNYTNTLENKPAIIRKPYIKTILGTIIGFMVGAPSIRPSKKDD